MKDFIETFEKILEVFDLELTGWIIAIIVLLYFSRQRIQQAVDRLLDKLGKGFGGEWSYRRFDPKYRKYMRQDHLYLKLVGIRTEEERRPRISEAYTPIKLVTKGGQIESAVLIEQASRDNKHLLILGDPGSGKTTVLSHRVMTLTDQQSYDHFSHTKLRHLKWLRRSREPLPIYVPLRSCLPENETLLDDLLDPKTEILSAPKRQDMPKGFIRRALNRRRAILLLDGLDEVANEDAYHAVARKVTEFTQIFPAINVVVTCRKAGWRGELPESFVHFVAFPLDAQQQRNFVHRWYRSVSRYVSYGDLDKTKKLGRAEREADNLLTLIQAKERIRELASNPLILSLICLVHRQRKDLPRGRAALYEDCIDILLGLWDRIDKDFDQSFPTTRQKKLLLRRIAYQMQSKGWKEIGRDVLERLVLEFLPEVGSAADAVEIVRQVEVRSGLMVERAIDKLTFSHLTFQEYFVVEFFNSEREAKIPWSEIDDLPAWREPILLMAGTQNDPEPLISQVFRRDALMGIYAIYEVDPSSLTGFANEIVDQVIGETIAGRIPTNDAISALTSLISIEGNPFGEQIVRFVYDLVQGFAIEEMSSLTEVLSKTPTRESSRLMLSLLTEFDLAKDVEGILVSGLARIGDPAVYESLEWLDRGDLSEELLFQILVECESPHATKTLWLRYETTPPQDAELAWAKTWALRLAKPHADESVRNIVSASGQISNGIAWPYDSESSSAVKAIVTKATEILQSHYVGSEKEFLTDLDLVSQFALRVQIPLLIHVAPFLGFGSILRAHPQWHETSGQKSRRELARSIASSISQAFYLDGEPSDLEFRHVVAIEREFATYDLGLTRVFNRHAWTTLRGFLQRDTDSGIRWIRWMALGVGILIEILSLVAVILGMRALLPPDGTYSGFWTWLPLWVRISVPGVIFVISFIFAFLLLDVLDFSITLMLFAVALILVALAIFAPLVYLLIFIWAEGTQSLEKMMSSRKIDWGLVVGSLSFSALSAIFGSGVLEPWIEDISLPVIIVVGTVVLLGVYLQTRASVFQYNAVFDWLKQHPRGQEVLDEFSRHSEIA